MAQAPPPGRIRRALALSMTEGALYAVMVGVSESYLGVLAVELGFRDTALALLVTVPALAGALAQLASGPLSLRLGGRKRLVVAGAALQAACHLGFLWIAVTGERHLLPFLVIKTLFWVGGTIIAPAWNAWMGTLTEDVARARYFAVRSMLVYGVLVAAFLGGGLFLEHGRRAGHLFAAFGWLYAVALGARTASALVLAAQHDPGEPRARLRPFARLRLAVDTASWRVAAVVALVMAGASVAVPFFTPYMLRTLHLGFVDYAGLTAVSIAVKALTFPLHRRLADRFGLRASLVTGGLGVAAVPLLWAGSTTVPALVAVEALAGASWAAFEFASFQLLLASSDPRCRVEFFSLANSGSGALQLAGSMGGSFALATLGLTYPQVFVLSSALRALPVLALVSPALVAVARRGPLPRIFLRVVSVWPSGGVTRRPILQDVAESPAPGAGGEPPGDTLHPAAPAAGGPRVSRRPGAGGGRS